MNADILLLRQIHPTFIQGNQVSKTAFTPNRSDKGLLSVYDGSRCEPEEAFTHYTEVQRKSSGAVASVTVEEALLERVTPRLDPLDSFEYHAVIDYTGHEEKEWKGIAKKLAKKAENRGYLYVGQPNTQV